MTAYIRRLFATEHDAPRGLLAFEWVAMTYLLLTLLLALAMGDRLPLWGEMIGTRLLIVAVTLLLWRVYLLVPCRFVCLCRVVLQMGLLAWWYPDTYDFNQALPSLDHLFARADEWLFGCQPALLFPQVASWPWFSELLAMSYAAYYPLIALVTLYYFIQRYDELTREVMIVLGSFFIYYLVFIFLPVAGPQYYYLAVGIEQIAQGVLPEVGHYFATHLDALPIPGWNDGLFYQLVESAHQAGERPTAAFPSSHVGATTILLILARRTRSRWLTLTLALFLLLMCLSTVYLQAHYVVDVVAGLLSAPLLYGVMTIVWQRLFSKAG